MTDRNYSFIVNICVEIVIDTTIFSYNAYMKYVQDLESYDRRSGEKKIKNATKLKLRSEFPISISKVICVIISSM